MVDVVEVTIQQFIADLAAALPKIAAGLMFLVLAGVLVKLVLVVVQSVLRRMFGHENPIYVQFIATIIAAFLWFGVLLSFLSIVGLGEIAAALGTASGFLALGVSYALSGMIADAVAGIYLLRDPDFNPGDTVTADDTTGEVLRIELRKTRFKVEDTTVVKANSDIEKGWTKVE